MVTIVCGDLGFYGFLFYGDIIFMTIRPTILYDCIFYLSLSFGIHDNFVSLYT